MNTIPKYKQNRFKLFFFPIYWTAKLIKILFKRQFMVTMEFWNRLVAEVFPKAT